MVKNCKVLINNEAVTVFDYDGIQVQIPSIKRTADFIKVIKRNGNYIVVDDSYIEPANEVKQIAEKPKKKATKKTTVKESVNENIEIKPVEENEDA